ncbi:MAG: CoA transferase, partial [Calditrichaeota bacterium]|nr:CoA transferase [Calditrichota bacterium]
SPAGVWLEKLQEAGIPAGPINTPEQALAEAQVLARGLVVELEHPLLGTIRSLGSPMKLSGTPVSYRLPPPLLGEHTGEILQELGYDENAVAELRGRGVV